MEFQQHPNLVLSQWEVSSGYRQAQKGGESVFAQNKNLWGKWTDHRISGKVDGREWKGGKLVDLLPKGAK